MFDLSQGYDSSILSLNGQWLFYWKALLTPEQLNQMPAPAGDFVQVPASWTSYQINGKSIPVQGFATYTLQVQLPEDKLDQIWSIEIPAIISAYTLFINE